MRCVFLLIFTISFLSVDSPAYVYAYAERTLDCDLLVVGANEAGYAAAVTAARLGVGKIVLVNDVAWPGGQFSAEGVGCLDEWTIYRGKRVNFPRSGLFLEIVREIRRRNAITYGQSNPGNAWCGTETIEPAAAAQLFSDGLADYEKPATVQTGQITYLHSFDPVRVRVAEGAVTAVEFVPVAGGKSAPGSGSGLTVTARLTMDCTDWGDIIRLSGARYAVGPDEKACFGEAGAPVGPLGKDRGEMNPLSWCIVLREADKESTIALPDGYDARAYAELDKTPPFADWDGAGGIYAKAGWSVYTHRRLVDRRHFRFPVGTEAVFLNWPVQDYPLYDFPARVAAALEADQAGASQKTLPEMTPAQRRIVYADAKRHALGMLYHLQTKVHDRIGDYPESFRYMKLTDEFGTADQLPPKPYIREGLRLEALYMLRESDIRAADRNPLWAKSMVPDGVFGFQFNIDFHPTRRKFLNGDHAGPWVYVHTTNRNWHTDTDRALFPMRSLIPVAMDGLIGSSKNIGVSSLVSAAVRVHGQMTLCGQAAGAVAAVALRHKIRPRDVVRRWSHVREVQTHLIRPPGGAPGVLLWPFHDLAPDDLHFEAVNQLAVRGIPQGDPDSLDFDAYRHVTLVELDRILKATSHRFGFPKPKTPVASGPGTCDWKHFAEGLESLGLKPPAALRADPRQPLTREECARMLWSLVRDQPEQLPDLTNYLNPGSDLDADGIPDLDDPLPIP